ncbi:MAG: hypothetical protein QXJ28_01020 [Candidatus Pacearchaeota archaeon]
MNSKDFCSYFLCKGEDARRLLYQIINNSLLSGFYDVNYTVNVKENFDESFKLVCTEKEISKVYHFESGSDISTVLIEGEDYIFDNANQLRKSKAKVFIFSRDEGVRNRVKLSLESLANIHLTSIEDLNRGEKD